MLSGDGYQLKSFVVTVLGGFGNPVGALLGGVALGVLEGAGHALRAGELDAGDRICAVRTGADRLSRRTFRVAARSAVMLLLRLSRRPFFWIIALVIAVFAVAPAIGNNVDLRESLVLAAVYITLASNLNLMLGYAGYINFGSIVFFGLGGYICVWLVTRSLCRSA